MRPDHLYLDDIVEAVGAATKNVAELRRRIERIQQQELDSSEEDSKES